MSEQKVFDVIVGRSYKDDSPFISNADEILSFILEQLPSKIIGTSHRVSISVKRL